MQALLSWGRELAICIAEEILWRDGQIIHASLSSLGAFYIIYGSPHNQRQVSHSCSCSYGGAVDSLRNSTNILQYTWGYRVQDKQWYHIHRMGDR